MSRNNYVYIGAYLVCEVEPDIFIRQTKKCFNCGDMPKSVFSYCPDCGEKLIINEINEKYQPHYTNLTPELENDEPFHQVRFDKKKNNEIILKGNKSGALKVELDADEYGYFELLPLMIDNMIENFKKDYLQEIKTLMKSDKISNIKYQFGVINYYM